ncbi:thyrostimulin alpha-2 subunit-like [Styela clava]|uniref:thyrostimulin alpha-2 subunit-like n=1 Tax=Styela clava TaxID=7725 RepID=UPI001939DAB7|nr:thyrostimulin alpha-2 subunit-like [Styela clava]
MASLSFFTSLLLFVVLPISLLGNPWEKPGCHLTGFSLVVKKENCQKTVVHINACRGCCASLSYPSSYETVMLSHGRHNFTSRASCCSIAKAQVVHFKINCGGVPRIETIQSAERCSCGVCKDY